MLPLAWFPGDSCSLGLICPLPLSGRHSAASEDPGVSGYATKNTANPRKAAETPRTNHSSLLSASGRPGDTREHRPPRNKGAGQGTGPAFPRPAFPETSSGQAQLTGRGWAPDLKGILPSCARSGGPGGQGASRVAGSPRDTLTPSATLLWAGGLCWTPSRDGCPALPRETVPRALVTRPSLGLLDGQAFAMGGLLYGGSSTVMGVPSSTGGPSSTGTSLYGGGAFSLGGLPLWGSLLYWGGGAFLYGGLPLWG